MFALEDLRVARYAAGGSMPAHVREMASLNLDQCRLFKPISGSRPRATAARAAGGGR